MKPSTRISFAFLAILALLASAFGQAAEDKSKRPSPPAKAETTVNGKKITIDYGAPSVRGRKIFGGLEPYGVRWRAGANESTTLVTPVDLVIGGAKVPAGTYTLSVIPGEKEWTLIINKQTGQWGTEYDPKRDLVRVKMELEKTKALVEKLKYSFEPEKGKPNEFDLVLEWEYSHASVDVKAK